MSVFPLGSVFGQVAEEYDEVRPPYPDELWSLLDAEISLAGKEILDLAAGTGMATRPLVSHGARVVALEPDAGLRSILRRRSPDVPTVSAVAEALPFAADSFDAVTCGTAWHWFDSGRSAAEAARVLRPGGRLALFWANHSRGDVDWELAQSAIYEQWQAKPGSLAAMPEVGVRPSEAADDLRSRGFDVTVDTELRWERRVSRQTHLAVLSTHSVVIGLGADKQQFLDAVAAALEPWPVLTERLSGVVVVASPTSDIAPA